MKCKLMTLQCVFRLCDNSLIGNLICVVVLVLRPTNSLGHMDMDHCLKSHLTDW